jgi:N-acetylmuramic acid 6-phosphate etherase
MDLESFMSVCDQFRLGELETEMPHPETVGLAEFAEQDVSRAIEMFHRVDLLAIERVAAALEPLPDLVDAMRRTLESGGRIFFCGCGATGRLSLSLETLAREAWLGEEDPDRIIGFMAGGDGALIRSLEAFEDYPEYGVRQLTELGFTEKDLLVAITEGGETPFVIGACVEAARIANEKPWFLFCNPPAQLSNLVERSRAVLESKDIRSFYLPTGPMALAGSTRLQATTVQMLVPGAALMEALGHGQANELIEGFRSLLQAHDPAFLAPFIEAEANIYDLGHRVLYQTDHYGITLLTDTTERAPTFSLAPFENRYRESDESSWCYLSLPGTIDAESAWHRLLHRQPRTLEWPELQGRASMEYLLGHDISGKAAQWRHRRQPDKKQYPYLVFGHEPRLEFAGLSHALGLPDQPLLLRHLMLKCCLNLQSTLVMGRLGLFESNLMTRVKPSNYKLIDRAARHAQHFHRQKTGQELDYASAVKQVFAAL